MENCIIAEEQENFWLPQPGFLFPVMEDFYGSRLALIFGNENGKCPFYDSQCDFCQIGAGEYGGHKFSFEENSKRLEWFVSQYGVELLSRINHLLIYNSGSVLDEGEMSRKTLNLILKRLISLVCPTVVSLDTRDVFITDKALSFLHHFERSGMRIHFSIGLETFDDKLRKNMLHKYLFIEPKLYERISKQSYNGLFGIDINFVFGLPNLSLKQSINDITQGIEHFNSMSTIYGVKTDFNIHPFYPNEKTEQYFPLATSPGVAAYKQMLDCILSLKNRYGDQHLFYIGINDEGLSLDLSLSNNIVDQVKEINRLQRK